LALPKLITSIVLLLGVQAEKRITGKGKKQERRENQS
jgi:hypothetical protein